MKKQEARLEAAQGLCQGLLIHMAVTGEWNLPVGDAKLLEGPLPLAPQADHLLKGFIGAAGSGQQRVPRTQDAKQGRRNGMGPADELEPYSGSLRLHDPGKHPIQGLSSRIPVGHPCGTGKVVLTNALSRKSIQKAAQMARHGGATAMGHGCGGCLHLGQEPIPLNG